jgi:hypothetical protein
MKFQVVKGCLSSASFAAIINGSASRFFYATWVSSKGAQSPLFSSFWLDGNNRFSAKFGSEQKIPSACRISTDFDGIFIGHPCHMNNNL